MRRFRPLRATLTFLLVAVCVAADAQHAYAQWPQWGGPDRNFSVPDAKGLADSWPERGPKKLWKRRLGDGFSAIVVDDGLVYTMYRKGKRFEYTVALDARTGEQVWEYRSPSPVPKESEQFPGPDSTPLVAGNRLFSIGRNAVIHCFDKKSGEVLWRHDLVPEFGCVLREWGYACSPIAYGDLVILPVGRREPPFSEQPPPGQEQHVPAANEEAEGRTLMAFAQSDGKVAWKSQDFGIDHSSPILIRFNGRDQIVLVTPEAVFAVDPANGDLFWQHAFGNIEGYMATPIWTAQNLLFCSTPGSGSRVFDLIEEEGRIVPRQRWQSNHMRLVFLNPVPIGEYIVGSNGYNPATLACVDIKTGERLWVTREIAAATLLHADGKLIILTEDGELALATATPEGLSVHARCKITEKESYTAPTLAGTTLYVRDRKHIMALDLG